ncbi:muscarinic acetylcholine receptor DM1-like [Pollicipes pollicipes]|uniref:muscarinic acetylcholine receptor DM1-like n=1 Tax=Pollicipes pollicipes TaxID=41117 RepID=UPI0018851DC3|nr:muscarinic acetylcholine receptor DM1-like [Pollicipes pollicipes]
MTGLRDRAEEGGTGSSSRRTRLEHASSGENDSLSGSAKFSTRYSQKWSDAAAHQATANGGRHLQLRQTRSVAYNTPTYMCTLSAESVYTIVIKFPETVTASTDPSITMLGDSDDEEDGHQPRPSQMPDLRIPLNARVIPRQPAPKKKKKREEKKQDRKAAKTLSAILLAFIITWTPYNVLVLIRVMLQCGDCIPKELWNFSYYLCYINSTVNPLCYALCNASFRRTYVKILTCTWQKNKRHPASRVYYN